MSQTLKRGGTPVRKVAAQQGTARKVRTAKARTGSAVDGIMSWLPFTEAQLHRAFLAMILGGAAVLAWFVASLAGVPAMAAEQLASVAGDAGFRARHIDLRGVKNVNELKVYSRVELGQPMPLVDVAAVRDSLLELSWIKDARVSRQLPDTLVIDIVERTPYAVLRKADRLVLIDAEGRELEPVSPARAKGKLVLSGMGAGKKVEALTALLGAAPALKPQVREAEWIGNRRWNLTFRTGQVLALPQGEGSAANALLSFARLDGTNRLLGGKVMAFDMRAKDRIYLRLPTRPDDAEMVPAKSGGSAAKPSAPARKPASSTDTSEDAH